MKNANLQILINNLIENYGIKSSEATKRVYYLWKTGKIDLLEKKPSSTFFSYLSSLSALWFWVLNIVLLLSLTVIIISNAPLLYVRYILGSIYILYLPGSVLIETLYPRGEDQNTITRIALSVVSSLSIVSLVAFILNYTPLMIRLIPITLSLAFITEVLAICALFRKYKIRASMSSN